MNRKILMAMGIIIYLFIAYGCSRTSPSYIGMVNDRPITQQEYSAVVRSQYESYILETGIQPDEITWQRIQDQAWSNMVEGIIFQEQLRKHEIVVTHQETINHLIESPPELILNSRIFRTNEEFDTAKYRDSLINKEPVDLSWLIRYYFEIYIPLQKLEERIVDTMEVTDQEILKEFMIMNSAASASIIHFPAHTYNNISISDREVRRYYQNNREQYVLEPYTEIKYVVFPLIPSTIDTLITKTRIDSVYTELQDGMEFGMFASMVSDSPTARDRGELPFRELSSLPDNIERQVGTLELEEYTRPISTYDGWVIYQLTARTRNLVKLREIFIEHKASPKTKQVLLDEIINIRTLAEEIGFDRAAYEYNLDVHATERITPDDPFIPILGKSDSIINRAINAEHGAIFEPVFHKLLNSYVLIHVVDNQRHDFKQVYAVADEIRRILHREKQQEMAENEAETYYRKQKYSRIIEQAQKDGITLYHFDILDMNTYFPDADITPLIREMLGAEKNRFVTKPVSLKNGSYIVVVHRFMAADRSKLEGQRSQLRREIRERREKSYFSEWLKDKIENAKVRDWRSRSN
jgi:peptidyl-prolyl cis-trans isomerase D